MTLDKCQSRPKPPNPDGGVSDPGKPGLGVGRQGCSGAPVARTWEGLREGPDYPLAGGRTEIRGGTQKYSLPDGGNKPEISGEIY